jgi:hypothetical protein
MLAAGVYFSLVLTSSFLSISIPLHVDQREPNRG